MDITRSINGAWHQISYEHSSLSGTSFGISKVTYQNGETERKNPPPRVMRSIRNLRYGMYQSGRGTWFSMTYKILHSGSYNIDFNYDDRPVFLFPPAPGDYADDLELFPRSPEHVPGWLQEELRKAEQG